VLWAQQEPQEQRVLPEPLVQQALAVLMELQELWVQQEPREQRALPEPLVRQELLVPMELQEL
jgi:hypothetical protein